MSENNLNFSTVRTVTSATASDIRLLVLDLDGKIVDESNHVNALKERVKKGVSKRCGIASSSLASRR